MSNLISCIECGNNLSERASSCPKCQTRRFKGVECKACNGILKGSECTSILTKENKIIEISFDGEAKDFTSSTEHCYKWIGKLYPYSEFLDRHGDNERCADMYTERYEDGTAVYTFHSQCFDSITDLKQEQEVIIVECVSCSSKIRFESYVSSIDRQNCRVCGEPNITANAIAETNRRKNNCVNCNLPVLKSKGIEVFKLDKYSGYSENPEYAHQVCLNERISEYYFTAKEIVIRQDIEAKKKAEKLAYIRSEHIAEQRREKVRSLRKILIIFSFTLVLIGLAIAVCHPFVLPIIKSLQYAITKDGIAAYILMLLIFTVIGFMPVCGEIGILVSTICLIMILSANPNNTKEPGLLGNMFIMFTGIWTGFLTRSWLSRQ